MGLSPEDIRSRVFKIRTLMKHASDEAGGIHSPESAVEGTQVLLGVAEQECEDLYRELGQADPPRVATG